MSDKFEKHIEVSSSQITALECLSENTDFSKQKIKRIMQNGAVWLESSIGIDRIRRAKKNLKAGDKIHLYYDEGVQETVSLSAKLIADEGDYSIWNKPGGMFSQGSKWGDHCTIHRWAEMNLLPQRQAFIVHRLDRAANGLIILAHKKSIARKFSAMFENREIFKKYKARVEGVVSLLDLPYEIKNELDNKLSISEIVSVTQVEKDRTDLEVVIKTGRKHQIRRHLSGLGHPIEGDRLYGAKNIDVDLQLSAVHLRFLCPVTGEQKEWYLK